MSDYRQYSALLTKDVWKACLLIAKSRFTAGQQGQRIVTADQVANELLQSSLWDRYPHVVNHIKAVRLSKERAEKQIMKELLEVNFSDTKRVGVERDSA